MHVACNEWRQKTEKVRLEEKSGRENKINKKQKIIKMLLIIVQSKKLGKIMISH
jgi:hypothetical protein